MKTIFAAVLGMCLSVAPAYASKINRADTAMNADASAYITRNRMDANCIVYLEGDDFQARDTGIWYFTNSAFDADATIYFTDNRMAADIIVYFTNNRMEAKCMY